MTDRNKNPARSLAEKLQSDEVCQVAHFTAEEFTVLKSIARLAIAFGVFKKFGLAAFSALGILLGAAAALVALLNELAKR